MTYVEIIWIIETETISDKREIHQNKKRKCHFMELNGAKSVAVADP